MTSTEETAEISCADIKPERPGLQEAVILALATILMTIIYYNGHPGVLPKELHLFTIGSTEYVLPTAWHGDLYRAVGLHAFRQQRLFNWFLLNFLLLFCVPVAVIKLYLKRPLSEFGVQWGDAKLWGKYVLAFMAVVVPCVLIAAKMPSFQSYYSYHDWAGKSLQLYLLFAGGWLLYFLAWEFFFRGFLLFGMTRTFGKTAIYLQMVPFVMMHFNKPELETLSAIIAGIALGLMAYRTKSFVGCWLLHWVIALLMYSVVFMQ